MSPARQAASAASLAPTHGSGAAGQRHLSQEQGYNPACIPAPGNGEDCYVWVPFRTTFTPVGTAATVDLTCGAAAATLTPIPLTKPTTGCYDVSVSVTDMTDGTAPDLAQVNCDNVAAQPSGNTADCTPVQPVICPSGASLTGTNCTSTPCANGPGGISGTYSSTDNLCHVAPTGAPPTCPAGTTAVTNSSGTPVDCEFVPQPRSDDQVSATINPGAPDAYAVRFHGFIGTLPGDGCPAGTTLTPGVPVAATIATLCAFTVSTEVKFIETTTLTITPLGPCGGAVMVALAGISGGTPCFFALRATGTVLLKQGVDCSNPGEPTTGSSAVAAGFLPGSTYACTNGALTVTNVPVPGLRIFVHAQNGIFGPNCIPQALSVPATPLPTAVQTPQPTSTPGPTATPTQPPPPVQTAFCTVPPGAVGAIGSVQFTACLSATPTCEPVVTDEFGTVGSTAGSTISDCENDNDRDDLGLPPGPNDQDAFCVLTTPAGVPEQAITFYATPHPPFVLFGADETVVGTFLINQEGVMGIPTFTVFHFTFGDLACTSEVTDASGNASCTRNTDSQPIGSTIPVNETFIYNCNEYNSVTSFTIVNGVTPTPVATPFATPTPVLVPAGVCVLRTGTGPLTVSANVATNINTQPGVAAGPVLLGNFGPPTPTAAPSLTPTPTPLPTAVPTNTPVPTPTTGAPPPTAAPAAETATPTPVPTPQPTVAPGALRFVLEAARVAEASNPGNRHGLDTVVAGRQVRLMMYYTISSLPRTVTRVTTYEILDANGHDVFKVTFKGPEKAGDTGQFIRYTYFTAPQSMRRGVYVYRATLTLARHSQSRLWRFALLHGPKSVAVASESDRVSRSP